MKTLKDKIIISGVGLHSGENSAVSLMPYDRPGIYFNCSGGVSSIFEAKIDENTRLTGFSLPNGMHVRTAEHMLAAISGMGIESVLIELDGTEIPILDGSAKIFAEAISRTGLVETGSAFQKIKITKPFVAEENNGRRVVFAYPSDKLTVTYLIDYSGTPIGLQKVHYEITDEVFYKNIANARTFCLTYELDFLKKNGLAKGGSLDNAMVFDEKGLVGNNSLRSEKECVTHKVLDLMGDLTLIGQIPTAHYVAIEAGHSVHGKLVEAIKREMAQ